MDQFIKQNEQPLKKQEYKIIILEKEYLAQLELYEQRVKINIMIELSQQKWSDYFTIQQLYKVHPIFLMCDTLENSYDYLCEQVQSSEFSIDFNDQKLTLIFCEIVRKLKNQFTIQLKYENMDPITQIRNMYQIIIDLKQQVDQLQQNQKKSLIDQQEDQQKIQILEKENTQNKNKIEQLEKEFQTTKIIKQQVDQLEQNQKKSLSEQKEDQQKIQKQEKENTQNKNKIEQLEKEIQTTKIIKQQVDQLEQNQKKSLNEQKEDQQKIQKLEQENTQYKNKIEQLEKELQTTTKLANETITQKQNKQQQIQKRNITNLSNNFQKSKIIQNQNIEFLAKNISQNRKDIQLKLLYQASVDGFEASKFYEKCSNKLHTVVCIKTASNQRFGFYTDMSWTSDQIQKYPSYLFSFSLDSNQTFINQYNYITGFSGIISFDGNNIFLCFDQNQIQNSFVNKPQNFGMIGSNTRTYFTPTEIEVYQVESLKL